MLAIPVFVRSLLSLCYVRLCALLTHRSDGTHSQRASSASDLRRRQKTKTVRLGNEWLGRYTGTGTYLPVGDTIQPCSLSSLSH